ncbi:hypothetical protein [Marmoricola sp. URHA0025 HA25]
MLWRDTVLEEWHGAGRIHDAEMMAANVATTRIIRDSMWTQFADALTEGLDSRHALTLEYTEVLEAWFSCLHDDVFAPDRGLPHGITLAELARDELEEFSNRAGHMLDNLLDLADSHGPHATLMMLANWGKQARWWWSTPTWPYQVDEFLSRIDDPDHAFWKVGGPPGPAPEPGDDRAWLRKMLLVGPDQMPIEVLDWCIGPGGIGFARGELPPDIPPEHTQASA